MLFDVELKRIKPATSTLPAAPGRCAVDPTGKRIAPVLSNLVITPSCTVVLPVVLNTIALLAVSA